MAFYDKALRGLKDLGGVVQGIFAPKLISPIPERSFTAPKVNLGTQIQPTIAKTQPIVEQKVPESTPVVQQQIARNPSASKFTVTPQVQKALSSAGKYYGIKTPEILGDIALQESSFNPSLTAEMGGYKDSTAKGLFMFNDPTWQTVQNYKRMQGSTLTLPSEDRMNPDTAAMAAAYLIKNGQLGRWYPSAAVWAPHYTWEELQPYLTQTTDPKALETIKYYAKK